MVSCGRLLLFSVFSWTTTVAVVARDPIKYVQCPNSTISNTPVILQGKRFFKSDTGDYFPVKGIAYYPRPNDGLLSHGSHSVDFFTEEFRHLWEADIEHLKDLGVNTIRIYAVNPSVNHDGFMCALQAANIFVIVGLLADCEGCSIGKEEGPACYPSGLKNRGEWVINEFSKYANTLAFDAGNEVTLYAAEWGNVAMNAGCQKKFLRDMRQYVETCSGVLNTILPRKVPIGMVNWDYERDIQSLYFNCRTNTSDALETPEWYGLNSYQHCDPNDMLVGWYQLKQDFEGYDLEVPIVIAEYGCRERGFPTIDGFEAQRDWLQVDALYSSEYAEVFAGGVAFEYSAEKIIVDSSSQGNPWPYNGFMKLQYGVGYYSPIDCDHTTTSCIYNRYPEFAILKDKLAAADVSYAPNQIDDSSNQKGQVPQCPEGMPILSDFEWPSDDEPDLPCYVVATWPPTASPTTASPTVLPSASPSMSPTKLGELPSSNTELVDGEYNDASSGIIPVFSSSNCIPVSVPAFLLLATTSFVSMAMGF
jgi:1,3-beta-glucanosyltransferase GAS5